MPEPAPGLSSNPLPAPEALQVYGAGRGLRFGIRVTPGARRSELCGVREGALLVRLQAPPVDGKANLALAAFLGDALGLRATAVTLVSGEKSRHKIVEVAGLDTENLRSALRARGIEIVCSPRQSRPHSHPG